MCYPSVPKTRGRWRVLEERKEKKKARELSPLVPFRPFLSSAAAENFAGNAISLSPSLLLFLLLKLTPLFPPRLKTSPISRIPISGDVKRDRKRKSGEKRKRERERNLRSRCHQPLLLFSRPRPRRHPRPFLGFHKTTTTTPTKTMGGPPKKGKAKGKASGKKSGGGGHGGGGHGHGHDEHLEGGNASSVFLPSPAPLVSDLPRSAASPRPARSGGTSTSARACSC